jgi:hypothetical protein
MSQSALSIHTHSTIDLTYLLDEPASPTYPVTAQEVSNIAETSRNSGLIYNE